MTDMSLDADEFVRAADALSASGFDRQAARAVSGALRKMANAVRRHVRSAARSHRKTGRLSSNIRIRYAGTGMRTEAVVAATGPVAHLIAGGVRPHDIAPGHLMAIHGPGRSRPLVGFADAVHHPGFRADPFFSRGVREAEGDIDRITQEAIDGMVSDLAARIGG